MYIYVYILQNFYSLVWGEYNSMLRLKSFSKSITGESDRSFNSPPVDTTAFETGRTFPVFLLDSSSKSPDLNVSEVICNNIKGFV